jgi:benzoyl-CoA reductase/2-hydroxyglutaryl-CoA dehydratase subunit BcrC/BadD/HgdB
MSAADKLRAAAEALLLGREEKQRQELEAAAERIRQEAKKQEGKQ